MFPFLISIRDYIRGTIVTIDIWKLAQVRSSCDLIWRAWIMWILSSSSNVKFKYSSLLEAKFNVWMDGKNANPTPNKVYLIMYNRFIKTYERWIICLLRVWVFQINLSLHTSLSIARTWVWCEVYEETIISGDAI